MRSVLLTAPLLVLACAPDQSGGPSTDQEPPVVELRESSEGRTVVATVDGRPVFGDCVQSQARLAGVDKRTALEQCIEFEVLAGAAHRRFGRDAEVHATHKRETVRAMVNNEYLPSADHPDDVPTEWLRKNVWSKPNVQTFFNYEENRVAAYALSQFKQKMVDPAHDAQTRKLAEDWHAALSKAEPLTVPDFERIVHEVVGDRKDLKWSYNPKYQTPLKGRSVPGFANAVFALNPGQLSAVTKSRYGYFVILLRRVIPAKKTTFAQALPVMRKQVYQTWRKTAFAEFIEGYRKRADVTVEDSGLSSVRLDLPSEFRVPKAP